MTETLADRTIAALRREHEALTALIEGLTPGQLGAPSACTEWTVAQVLSHLGSGAEISRAGLAVALDGAAPPPEDFNQTVWDRWDGLAPAEQASGFLAADAALVTLLESVSPDLREQPVHLAVLPAPLPLGAAAGLRLNEVAQHHYDVESGVRPPGALDDVSAGVLAAHLSGDLGFLLGFLGHPDALPGPVTVAVDPLGLDLVIGPEVRLAPGGGAATSRFEGPPEAFLRLVAGRLSPSATPEDVAVTGDVDLDDLRRVFPGF